MKSFRMGITMFDTEVECHDGGNLHVARIYEVVEENGEILRTVVATGSAKRHPEDKLDKNVGATLAMSRAFERLGHRLGRRANGLVKHHDDMARDKARRQRVENAKAKQQLSSVVSKPAESTSVMSTAL